MRDRDATERRLLRDFGEVLARRRLAARLSQAELAERVGLGSAEMVSRYERGLQNPTLLTTARFARALGVSPADLLPPASRVAGASDLPERAGALVAGIDRLDPAAARLAVAALQGIAEGLGSRPE